MRQSITLQTNDANVLSGDILGRVNFAASNESSGGDALLIAASIYAEASGEFTAAVNPTNLILATSDDSGATARIRLTNVGHLLPVNSVSQDLGAVGSSYRNLYCATGIFSRFVGISNGSNTPAFDLDVRGTGYFSENIRTSGTIAFASGNASPVGVMQWDNGEGTVSLGLKGGNVNLEIGQEQVSLCYNGTASTITKGKVVYINGAQGQRPSITLASNDTEATSSKTLGIVAEDIASGAEGFVASYGIVRNLDTSAFIAGSGLWLGTSGNMTMTVPVQPLHSVFIGYALSINASSGRVFVRVQNGYELQELHNVLITSVSNGDLIQYDSATQLWKNVPASTVAAGSGITEEDSIINALIFG
jgi:hypothetical protein